MIAHWRKEIADLRASPRGSDFQKRMFYWFAASNILAVYRPQNNDGPGLGYLTLNRRAVRSTDVIEDGALTTLAKPCTATTTQTCNPLAIRPGSCGLGCSSRRPTS